VIEAFRTVWANPYMKVATGLVVLYVLFRLFLAVQPAGTLFLIALGIAYLFNPAVDWLERRRLHRGLGVLLVAVTLVVGTWGVTTISFGAIRDAINESEEGLALSGGVDEWFEDLPGTLERLLPAFAYDIISGPVRSWREATTPRIEEIGGRIYDAVSGTVARAANAVFVLILTVYVLYDYHGLNAALLRALPRPYQPMARSLAGTLDEATGGYVRGQALIAVAVGLMVYVGLTLVGLPLAGVIGFLAGLLNIVPFIGTIVPVIPAVFFALSGGWLQVILVLLVFVIANQIDSHVLTPMVLSRATSLHPVTVMVSVIAGFAVGGLAGAILAVPLSAFLKTLYIEGYINSDYHRRG
jgi:predicted PurR-regulated permease PerM